MIRYIPKEWKKLNLGCNNHPISVNNWTNVDYYPFPGIDEVANLNNPWPWKDSTINYIRAIDIVEHLIDPIKTMHQAWKCLDNGGIFEIWVPSTDGRGAFQDPTHVSYWNANSFQYYDQRKLAKLYPGTITCDFDIVSYDTIKNEDGVIWSWALCRVVKNITKAPCISNQWWEALSIFNNIATMVPSWGEESLGTMPADLVRNLFQK